MVVGSHYLVISEILKQQMAIAPISDLFELISLIQLNSIGSEFEAKNGIFTCVHPVKTSSAEDNSVALFSIQTNTFKDMELDAVIPHKPIEYYLRRNKPFYVKYMFISWETHTRVTLNVYLSGKVNEFNDSYIQDLLEVLFGGYGKFAKIDVGKIVSRDSSKDILSNYVKDLNLCESVEICHGDISFMCLDIQKSPFIKRVYISEDKEKICIFKEHVIGHAPVYDDNVISCTRFDLKACIDNIMKDKSLEFDSLLVEADYSLDDESGAWVLLTFCVNINIINKAWVCNMLMALADSFGIYMFTSIKPKKLTYLDVM